MDWFHCGSNFNRGMINTTSFGSTRRMVSRGSLSPYTYGTTPCSQWWVLQKGPVSFVDEAFNCYNCSLFYDDEWRKSLVDYFFCANWRITFADVWSKKKRDQTSWSVHGNAKSGCVKHPFVNVFETILW